MTNLEIPPCGPERDRLVAEAVGWDEVSDGLGGTLWVDAANKPTGYYSPNAMGKAGRPFRPSQSDADALAALEAWRTGNGICSYAVASPDPVDPGFRACLWYSADGQSVADCEASAPTLRDAATAALVRWRNERSAT